MSKYIAGLMLSFPIAAAILVSGCNRTPLNVHVDAPVASVTDTETKTQTASTTSVRTKTTTDTNSSTVSQTATSPITVTATATATETKTVADCNVTIDFTTAFHSKGIFNVKPGDKGVTLGTFMLTNTCAKKVEVRDTQIGFIDSSDPWSGRPWADSSAAGHAQLIADHIENCVLRGWPETKVYAGPVDPNTTCRADMIDQYDISPFDGTNAFALDVVCDFTDLEVASDTGFGVEIMDYEEVRAYDPEGNRVRAVRRTVNGSPPAVAAVLQPPSCTASAPVTIGTGIYPAISSSSTGFGIVWKDMSHMPEEMNVGWFRSIDIGGNAWSKDQDILHFGDDPNSVSLDVAGTANGYLTSNSSGQYTSYSVYDSKGAWQGSALNQSLAYLIAGSDNNSFTFLDSGEGYPALHKLQVTGNSVTDVTKEQWGPSSGTVVTSGVQANGTWAFGFMNYGIVTIAVIRKEGVYTSSVDIDASDESVTLHDLIATDDSYVLSWSRGGKRYLSFAYTHGQGNGFVYQTVESVWLIERMYQIDHLAWDGKHIALLTTSVSTGQSDLILFDKNGKEMGALLNLVPAGQGKWFDGRADLAATNGTFGVVTSDTVSQTVKYYQIHCQ